MLRCSSTVCQDHCEDCKQVCTEPHDSQGTAHQTQLSSNRSKPLPGLNDQGASLSQKFNVVHSPMTGRDPDQCSHHHDSLRVSVCPWRAYNPQTSFALAEDACLASQPRAVPVRPGRGRIRQAVHTLPTSHVVVGRGTVLCERGHAHQPATCNATRDSDYSLQTSSYGPGPELDLIFLIRECIPRCS